ncbi:MAG: glycosyltransferase [Bacteroidetes bacterium]|nr:glycosyltransferase [Bacteroidota bacterium]
MNEPIVSLAMIVKNEEAMLPECLESVNGIVDEVVVVDTGSTDATRDVAKALGAHVYVCPWTNNFAEARNRALRYCTGTWILQLDADERLAHWNKAVLLKHINNNHYDAFIVTIESPMGEKGGTVLSSALRLFRRDATIEYEGIIHESVLPSLQRHGGKIGILPLRIYHVGYEEPSRHRQKALRNVALMEEYLAQNQNDTLMGIHYAMGLTTLHRFNDAKKVLHSLLRNTDTSIPLVVTALNLLAQIALEEKEIQLARKYTDRSLSLFPEQMYARKLRVVALVHNREYSRAEQELLGIIEMLKRKDEHQQGISWYDSFPAYSEVVELLGACLAEQGKFEEALEKFLEAILVGSDSPSIIVNIKNILSYIPTLSVYEEKIRKIVASNMVHSSLLPYVLVEVLCANGKYNDAMIVGKNYSIPEKVMLECQVRWMVQRGEERFLYRSLLSF